MAPIPSLHLPSVMDLASLRVSIGMMLRLTSLNRVAFFCVIKKPR